MTLRRVIAPLSVPVIAYPYWHCKNETFARRNESVPNLNVIGVQAVNATVEVEAHVFVAEATGRTARLVFALKNKSVHTSLLEPGRSR
jgi:hypothetical protein